MLAASPPRPKTETARETVGRWGERLRSSKHARQRCERATQTEAGEAMSVHSLQNRNDTFWSLDNLSQAKRRIVEFLESKPTGATRHEIAAALVMPLSSVAGRVCELEAEGIVRSTDQTRPTPYGKTATVVQVCRRSKPVQLELFS